MKKILATILILVLLPPAFIFCSPVFQTVKAQGDVNSLSDGFSNDSGSWQYYGSAYRDPTNQCLVLTTAATDEGGVAFFSPHVQGTFTATFRYKSGGADGFTMFFYKQKYTNPDMGGSQAFSAREGEAIPVPGYGIEFDGWQNIPADFAQFTGVQQNPIGDPSPDHIALIQNCASDHLTWVNDVRTIDSNWHQASVQVQESSVTVYVDQSVVLQWSGELNRTYDCIGFSGGTGDVPREHIIDDFSISSHDLQPLQKPTLTASCVSSVLQSTFKVKIEGSLSFDSEAISGAPILLSYSVTGGESWQDLTLVTTGADGNYMAEWLVPVTGNYMLKAVYKGSENYLGTSTVVDFAIAPCQEQSVFSVNSNSSITALYFNSDTKELGFNVTGESGTTGYVNVYVPKSLMNDTDGLIVYLDNTQIDYTCQAQGDCWLLSFNYHHSVHSVVIDLSVSSKPNGNIQQALGDYTILIAAALIAIIIFSTVVAIKAVKKIGKMQQTP
jgi:hypothetical protein